MSSEFFPWELNHGLDYKKLYSGVHVLQSFDSFIERIVLSKVKRACSLENGEKLHFRVFIGSEINNEWIDDNLRTLSFFSFEEHFLILNAEKIPAKTLLALEEITDWTGKNMVFCFQASGKLKSDVFKTEGFSKWVIRGPRFWESQKYLDFLAGELGVKLSFKVKEEILKSVTPDSEHFIEALQRIRAGGESIQSHDDLLSLINHSKVDHFELATNFGEKKFEVFYSTLLKMGEDFDRLRSTFFFLQGHLEKVIDPSYIKSKAKPSKYDQQILGQRKLWEDEEIKRNIQLFSSLEIGCKKRDPFLINKIQSLYLNYSQN
jgi:hypothetical protein